MGGTAGLLCTCVAECVLVLSAQPPLGDRDDGRDAEVPEPDEPKRGRGGRAGQTRGPFRKAAQPQTSEHRVGPAFHCKICECGFIPAEMWLLGRSFLNHIILSNRLWEQILNIIFASVQIVL